MHHVGRSTEARTAPVFRQIRTSVQSKNPSRPVIQPLGEVGGGHVPSENVFKALIFTGAVGGRQRVCPGSFTLTRLYFSLVLELLLGQR